MDDIPRDYLMKSDEQFIFDNFEKMSVYQLALRLGVATKGKGCPIITTFLREKGVKRKDNTPPKSEAINPIANIGEEIQTIARTPVSVDVVSAPNADGFTSPMEVIDEGEQPYRDDVTPEEFVKVLRKLRIEISLPLSEKARKEIIFIMKQMKTARFTLMYGGFRKREYKKLFEEEFIRSLYGKGEMPNEEVQDFIDVCNEIVFQYDIKCKIKELEIKKAKPDTPIQNQIACEQIIMEFNDKYAASTKRVSELKKTLGISREQRIKESRPVGLTVLSLIETFQDLNKRQEMFRRQTEKDAGIRKDISQLDEFDETKALILGMSEEEMLEGGL